MSLLLIAGAALLLAVVFIVAVVIQSNRAAKDRLTPLEAEYEKAGRFLEAPEPFSLLVFVNALIDRYGDDLVATVFFLVAAYVLRHLIR